MAGSELISEEYKAQIRQLHEESEGRWGATASSRCYEIAEWLNGYRELSGAKDMLDYGSSNGKLQKQLRRRGLIPEEFEIVEYDPGYEDRLYKRPCDLVLCVDVLEHIEPELLENVLVDLHRNTLKQGLFSIAMYAAKKSLPDGRNAHLIIEHQDWWKDRLSKYFHIEASRVRNPHGNPTLDVYVRPIRLPDRP